MYTIDANVFIWFHGIVGKFGPLDWAASHLANDYFIPSLITLIAFGLWFAGRTPEARRENQMGFIYGIGSLTLSAILVAIVMLFYFRARPYVQFPAILPDVQRLFYEPTVSSFPSYPAAITFALAFGVWVKNRKVGLVLIILSVLMAVARVYVGVHYPLDVISGALIGIVTTYICVWVLKPLRPVVDYFLQLLERLFLA